MTLLVPNEEIQKQIEGFTALIEYSTNETVKGMEKSILTVFGVFVEIFAVIIIAIIVLSRRLSSDLTAPLLKLGEDVRKISGGDLSYRAEIRTNDEIGDLAVEFNSMAASLEAYIENLTRVTAEKERIGAELDIAKNIQSSMLPSVFPAFPERREFDIFATMDPAKEVGGDFYDFFMVDERHLAIVVADVSGKGVPAALFLN